MKTLQKINLIEEPRSEEVIQQELEEVLGGWNCGSYYKNPATGNNTCSVYDFSVCTTQPTSGGYCATYTF